MTRDQMIAHQLRTLCKTNPSKRAMIGFDGFVDELFRVVLTRENAEACHFYSTISQFSKHVADAAGKSADIELVSQDVKLGGNAPIMANAIAGLGFCTQCVGAMGYPEEHPVFKNINENCERISVCAPAYTYAYEFNNGKLMFANHHQLNALNWDLLKSMVGLNRLAQMAADSDLWAFVNWSVMSGAGSIWEGFFQEVLPLIPPAVLAEKTLFFDLADPSKRSKHSILDVLDLIRRYQHHCHVILGLNENEALRIYDAVKADDTRTEALPLDKKAQHIFEYLGIELLVVHPVDRCIAVSPSGTVTEYGRVITAPKLTTGGGDNFNAGFCFAHLLGLPPADAARTAMATSGCYVKNGHSPSLPELLRFMEESC